MRITGGAFRGRVLRAPKGNAVRPTSDRTRQAIFNVLMGGRFLAEVDFSLEGANVLDVFCGTGALGLEALSRGALHCTFIDCDRTSLAVTRENADALALGAQTQFLLRDATKLGDRPRDMTPVTLVFVDPPYRKELVTPTLKALFSGGWLADGAILVVETEANIAVAVSEDLPFEVLDARPYGDTLIRVMQYCEGGQQ